LNRPFAASCGEYTRLDLKNNSMVTMSIMRIKPHGVH
jgi:hypothetical protein